MTRSAKPIGKLGPRQGRFVEGYLVDLNAKQAVIRPGNQNALKHGRYSAESFALRRSIRALVNGGEKMHRRGGAKMHQVA
jgi:hypothetical protein